MRFAGVDLAWGSGSTGVAVIEKGEVIFAGAKKYSNKEIVEIVKKQKPCFVAIDAPLIVENEEGARPAEKEVARKFMKYRVGAYPVNRKIMEKYGGCRGKEIVDLLEKEGFVHSPEIKKREVSNKVFEVYPHPAIIRIFGIPRVLSYKRNKEDLKKYFSLLKSLEQKVPALALNLEFKNERTFVDILDAIFCAYLAYYFWYFGRKGYEVLGSKEEGYIIVPKVTSQLF